MALKVLSALDTAKTQYYHFKAIVIAGMGLFTDAYDLFCLPPLMRLIGRIYYAGENVPNSIYSTMMFIALLGTVIGQLVFGRLGDCIGRRRVYGLALMLMVVSSVGCGFSICTTKKCVLGSLGFFRLLLGIGIGGDYPLSATIMSEFANRRTRGAFIAAVFSMQGFGIVASMTVTMVVSKIFEKSSVTASENHTPPEADIAWRLILMLGCIPAALTYYWRMLMPETARYTALVERNVMQAEKDMEKVLDVPMSQIAEEYPFSPNPPQYNLLSKQFFRRHGRDLFSCSATWLLVDVVFYSSNLFQSLIYYSYIDDYGKKKMNAYDEAFQVARLQAIVAICSTIPGYLVTVYFIDRIGRVRIQLLGFFFMSLVYFVIGIAYKFRWQGEMNFWFMFLYGLTFFFANFGPNTTTFIVPAELFPARFRSTCHGISGAFGKVGAIVGSLGFLWASRDGKNGNPHASGMTIALMILGGVCVLGAVVTYFFTVETMGRSLEENENENESSELCFLRCLTDSGLRTHSSRSEQNIVA